MAIQLLRLLKVQSGLSGHDETQRNANSLRAKLIREKLDKSIDEFHETVHTEEVDRWGLLEEESSVCSSR